jgi:hypothetical protein
MPTEGNLFGDLLKIAEGNVAVASSRLRQFETYANTVSTASDPHAANTAPDRSQPPSAPRIADTK